MPQDKLKKKALDSMLGDVRSLMGKSLAPKDESLPENTLYEGKTPRVMEPKQSASGVLMPSPRKSMLDDKPEVDEELEELREKTDIGAERAKDFLSREKLAKNIGLEHSDDLTNPMKAESKAAGLTNFKVSTDDGEIPVDQETHAELQRMLSEMKSENDYPEIEVNGKVLKVKGLGANKVTIYRKK
jgi:hypothetical protein